MALTRKSKMAAETSEQQEYRDYLDKVGISRSAMTYYQWKESKGRLKRQKRSEDLPSRAEVPPADAEGVHVSKAHEVSVPRHRTLSEQSLYGALTEDEIRRLKR